MVGTVALFGCVAHSLDVVPVGITHEGPVVVRVVFGPHPRLVEYFGARGHGGFEEGLDGGSVGRSEGYVRLAEPLARGSRAYPKVGLLSDAEADHLAEVQYSSAAKRGEHRIVEGGAGRHLGALDRDVVKHGDIVLGASLDEQAEGMTSRVEVDANVILWLEVGKCCPDGERVRSALDQIVNMNMWETSCVNIAELHHGARPNERKDVQALGNLSELTSQNPSLTDRCSVASTTEAATTQKPDDVELEVAETPSQKSPTVSSSVGRKACSNASGSTSDRVKPGALGFSVVIYSSSRPLDRSFSAQCPSSEGSDERLAVC